MRKATSKQIVQAGKAEIAGLRMQKQVSMPLSMFNLSPYNPRSIKPEMMKSLKASLLAYGLVLNLVVQERSPAYGPLVLIGGHQRVTAMREICKEKGWPEPDQVPAVILDVPDHEAKKLNVALNRIEGDFDPYKLGQVFADIGPQLVPDDYVVTGFVPDDVDRLVKALQPPPFKPPEPEVGTFGASVTLSVEFSTVAQRDEAKALLVTMAKEREQLSGDALLQELKATRVVSKKRV